MFNSQSTVSALILTVGKTYWSLYVNSILESNQYVDPIEKKPDICSTLVHKTTLLCSTAGLPGYRLLLYFVQWIGSLYICKYHAPTWKITSRI